MYDHGKTSQIDVQIKYEKSERRTSRSNIISIIITKIILHIRGG